MNKKVIKYVLIVCGIVLLFGLGIWGYKYIKNRNDDKKVNENENELKEVESLTSYDTGTVGSYKLNYYYNGPIDMGQSCVIGSTRFASDPCKKFNYYLTIYINDSIKLKSSWMFYSHESYYAVNPVKSKVGFTYTTYVLSSKFLVISLSSYTSCVYAFVGSSGSISEIYCNGESGNVSKTGYPYTKVFDATTGDMIYAIPTNSNESISFTTVVYDGSTAISGSAFKNNMYVNANLNAIYYLKSNYTLSDGNNTEIHKVVFGDSYDNKYNDTIIAYTRGTIETNS